MNVQELIEKLQKLAGGCSPLIEYCDFPFHINGQHLSYIMDGDLYTHWLPEGSHISGDYVWTNIDNDQGFWITQVFPLSKQLDGTGFEQLKSELNIW